MTNNENLYKCVYLNLALWVPCTLEVEGKHSLSYKLLLDETCIITDNFLSERGIKTKQTKNHAIYGNSNFHYIYQGGGVKLVILSYIGGIGRKR